MSKIAAIATPAPYESATDHDPGPVVKIFQLLVTHVAELHAQACQRDDTRLPPSDSWIPFFIEASDRTTRTRCKRGAGPCGVMQRVRCPVTLATVDECTFLLQ